MSRPWRILLVLALAMAGLSLAGAVSAADSAFTVRGRVTHPDGSPAAGVELRLFALLPGEGIDIANVVWKIPNFDSHIVTTDADGRYVMTNVLDYPQNTTHWYAIRVTEKSRVWHGTVRFKLWKGKPDVNADIHMEQAMWVTIKLKDRSGKPFSGPRAVFVQTGTDVSDPAKGYAKFEELTFVNGEAGIRIVIRDKNAPVARIAVSEVADLAEAYRVEQSKGMKVKGSSIDGFKLTHRDAQGRPLERQLSLVPLTEKTLEFSL